MLRVVARVIVDELLAHILGFPLVVVALGSEEVREEKPANDDEKDEKFDENDDPQSLAHGHIAKTVAVKVENPLEPVGFALHSVVIFNHKRAICN
jgi:hypothetical protein